MLQSDRDYRNKNLLQLQQNPGGTFQGQNQCSDSLQNSKGSDALIVQIVVDIVINRVGSLINDILDDPEIGISLQKSVCQKLEPLKYR